MLIRFDDQERFARTAPRPGFEISWSGALAKLGGIAAMSLVAWFFVWAAVGGWRVVHHFVDRIMLHF